MMFIDYAIGWLRDASNDLSLVCRGRIIAHKRYKMYLYTRPIYYVYCVAYILYRMFYMFKFSDIPLNRSRRKDTV